jgi:hypothetical protein
VTYFQGLPGKAHAPYSDQWWFTDEFTDGPRRMMDGFWAVPGWAPANESHLLGSTSVVKNIAYGRGRIDYDTFDREATDVLRVDFDVTRVLAGGGTLTRRSDLTQEGFVFDPATRVLRIHHRRSGTIRIEGPGGRPPLLFVTFDDPHELAGTVLHGEYPKGITSWEGDSWSIHVPSGKFGTFNLAASTQTASFQLLQGRVFAGIDVYNAGDAPANLRVRCPEAPEISISLDAGAIKRLRTDWRLPCSRVSFVLSAGAKLQFDNLAYVP